MKLKDNKYFYSFLTGTCALCISILFYFSVAKFDTISTGVDTLVSILKPFIYGGVIAYLINPICKYIEALLIKLIHKEKLSKILSIFLGLIFVLIVLYLLIIMVVPSLISSINVLIKNVPEQSQNIIDYLHNHIKDNQVLLNYIDEVYNSMGTTLLSFVKNTVAPSLSNLATIASESVAGIFTICKNLLIGVIAAIYILMNKELFKEQAKLVTHSLLNEKAANIFIDEVIYTDRMFSGFISGKIIDSLIIGVICGIFCIIVKMPSALLVSVIVGITNVIPFFGPYIGAIPCAFLILIQNPTMAVVFVVFIIILQQIDGNIIGPKILGDSTGLSSFWVLFSILLFGGLFGFVGMIIGVPVFAVIYDIIRKFVNYKLKLKGRTDLIENYQTFKSTMK